MTVARIPSLSLTFVDGTGSTTTMRGYLPAGILPDVALAQLEGLASAAMAISGCKVVRTAVTYPFVIVPTVPPTTPVSALQEGIFPFNTDNDDIQGVISLPGFPSSKTVTTGPFAGIAIDITDSDVVNWVDELSAGGWCDPFGNDFTDTVNPYIREES